MDVSACYCEIAWVIVFIQHHRWPTCNTNFLCAILAYADNAINLQLFDRATDCAQEKLDWEQDMHVGVLTTSCFFSCFSSIFTLHNKKKLIMKVSTKCYGIKVLLWWLWFRWDWWLRALSFTVRLQSTNIGFLFFPSKLLSSYRPLPTEKIELQLSSYASNILLPYTCLTETFSRSTLNSSSRTGGWRFLSYVFILFLLCYSYISFSFLKCLLPGLE